jgi:YfiH family protein
MFVFHNSSYYQSTKLNEIPGICHGYSIRESGDMRQEDRRWAFMELLRLPHDSLMMSQQIHGNTVSVVKRFSKNVIQGTDGLIVRKTHTFARAAAVRVADCIPLLVADTGGSVVAAVHAGWKGLAEGIVTNTIQEFVRLGIRPENIIAAIGPHIGKCCYAVAYERAERFIKLYGNDPKMVFRKDDRFFLDLGYVAKTQLRRAGIKADNIDEGDMCTAHNSKLYYSFRTDTKESFGEILGVIGFR